MKKFLLLLLLLSCSPKAGVIFLESPKTSEMDQSYNIKRRSIEDQRQRANYYNSIQHKKHYIIRK